MSSVTTVGRLLFENAVPAQFREGMDPHKPLDSGDIDRILQTIAEKAPHQYRDVSHAMLQLGGKASSETEASFNLNDLRTPFDKSQILRDVDRQEDEIFARKDLSEEKKNDLLVKMYGKLSHEFPDRVFHAAHAAGSNLARMVASGARGSRGQLNSNIGADWLMLDQNSNPVPIGVRSSYAEGLSPAEYFAAAYGTRSGLIDTKFSTRNSGYLSKQLSAAAHDMVVTEKDCGTDRGLQTTPGDRDNVGAVLAQSAGGHPAGTILTTRMLTDLKHKGVEGFRVRSPLTCTAARGLCATCAGVRERGHLPALMDNVGLAAASSLSEPLSQGMLKSKHGGGVASSVGGNTSAFKQVDSLVQVPETFPGGATLARRDGAVTKIEPAPQGGHFVHVDGEQHYVGSDRDLHVKLGDKLEAGDTLSSGTPNPAEIVHHKGIGEGRLYFVNAMRRAFRDNGLPIDRRNLEIMGRALVNHVKVSDPDGLGHHLPDDIIEYNGLEHSYEPSGKTVLSHPSKAPIGSFLHRPALHYSIGTRITPRVVKTLQDAGEQEIEVGGEGPGFVPEMQRVADNPGYKEDWMAQFAGSHLKKRILQNVHSGDAVSHLHGVSYLPGLAKGVEFGKPPKGVVGY